jgi:hypothetical protein
VEKKKTEYRSEEKILPRVGVTYKTRLGFDSLHLIHSQLGTTGNTALSLIYTLYSSPLHTH